jgi:hypothetical protein
MIKNSRDDDGLPCMIFASFEACQILNIIYVIPEIEKSESREFLR